MADKDRLTEIEERLEAVSAEWGPLFDDARWLVSEVKRLRQGLCDCAGLAGGDQDGDSDAALVNFS